MSSKQSRRRTVPHWMEGPITHGVPCMRCTNWNVMHHLHPNECGSCFVKRLDRVKRNRALFLWAAVLTSAMTAGFVIGRIMGALSS